MKDVRTSHNCKRIALGLWSVTAALVAGAWYTLVVVQPDDFSVPGMFAITATVLAIAAGTAQLRMHLARLTRLVRITAGLAQVDPVNPKGCPEDRPRLRSVQ